MKKKLVVFAIAIVMAVVVFSGCGGGSNNGGSSIAPTTAHLTVTVKSSDGQVIEGAEVNVGENSNMTDANGKTIFDTLTPGDYQIEASKDGYDSASQNVSLKAGDQSSATLTLKKKESVNDTIKSTSKLKSYKGVIEMKSSNGESGKIVVIQDDFGKEQHVTMYGNDNKVQFELYVAGGKAKMRSGSNEWMDLPESSVQAMTKSTLGFAETMMNNTIEDFNKTITGKDVKYSVKRVGSETVNGYPAYKYHIFAKGKDEGNEGVLNSDIWIINRGKYKDYTTRVVMNAKDNKGEGTFTINLTDIGKDMHISLP